MPILPDLSIPSNRWLTDASSVTHPDGRTGFRNCDPREVKGIDFGPRNMTIAESDVKGDNLWGSARLRADKDLPSGHINQPEQGCRVFI